MSDTKRLSVIIYVALWCLLSLAFDVRAQGTIDLSPMPIYTEKRCSDPIELAQGQITVHKKLGTSNRVTGAAGGFGEIVPAAGGGGCSASPSVSHITTADYDSTGQSVGNGYRGQSNFVPAANGTICRVDISIKDADAATDWNVVIYNMSGNNLGTEVAHATAKAVSSGWNQFDLSAAVVTTGHYGIVLQHYPTATSYSAGSNLYHSGASDGGVSGAHNTWWADDKTQNDAFTGDIAIKIYYTE
jgi:hypothetical protein